MIDINAILINSNQPVFEGVKSNGNVLSATFKSKLFRIISGTKTFLYDGKVYYTDSLIFNINGTIYIPLESFFKNFGYTVNARYDSNNVEKKEFSYYTRKFTYYVLKGEEKYEYSNGIIYIKVESGIQNKVIYVKLYDSMPGDFLAKMKSIFSRYGLNTEIVSIDKFTIKPTVVFKQGSADLLWINFLKKTIRDKRYYTFFGYDGAASYSLVKDIGYGRLIVCPTTMLNNTAVGFVYVFSTINNIDLDMIAKGINEFYKNY
jgi:hypothetical protein